MITKRFILGIDPGSRCTGYGIIAVSGDKRECVTYDTIRTQADAMHMRLYQIQEKLQHIIAEFHPTTAAIEKIFTLRNPQSALKLGQARGAALVATAKFALPTFEYSARTIKQAVVGYGAASKHQVQYMVRLLLSLTSLPPPDSADALAVALCHAHHERPLIN